MEYRKQGSISSKIFGSPIKQAGKKEGGLGEGIFARLLSAKGGLGWESVSAILPTAEYQNRKIFVSLIEKKLGGARLKKCLENFSVLTFVVKRKAETLGGTSGPQGGIKTPHQDFS